MRSRLPELVDRIYEAAVEPSMWPAVMRDIASALNGPTATIRLHDLRNDSFSFLAVHPDYPLEADREYALRWAHDDPFRLNAERMDGRHVHTEQQLAPASGLSSAAIYNDFYVKWGWGRGIGGYVLRAAHEAAIFGAQRSLRDPAYSREEIEAAQFLAPHIARAVEVSRRLARAHVDRNAYEAALQAVDAGVVVFDGAGEVIFATAAAERILAARDGLVLERRTINADLPADAAALQDALRRALSPGGDRGGTACTIHRRNGPPLHLVVSPFGPRTAGTGALLVISDPDNDLMVLAQTLGTRHGLTPSEGRISAALCRGYSPSAIARACGISVHTVRTHLKNIQAKLGVRGQTQIVAELLRGPGFVNGSRR